MARNPVVVVAVVGAALLAGASIAAAHLGLPSAAAASATFDATTVDNLSSNTCTAANGDTIVWTKASYTGNASSSDSRLDGAVVIYARSVVDTTTGLGYVEGRFKLGPDAAPSGGHFKAALSGSDAAGLSEARVQAPNGWFLASFSSTFDPQNGFSNGALGTGSANGVGVVLSPDQGCPSSSHDSHSGHRGHHARGGKHFSRKHHSH
jgi:hypothetical protein